MASALVADAIQGAAVRGRSIRSHAPRWNWPGGVLGVLRRGLCALASVRGRVQSSKGQVPVDGESIAAVPALGLSADVRLLRSIPLGGLQFGGRALRSAGRQCHGSDSKARTWH